MNKIRYNEGFTLVEFVVTIAVASMITLAATTMLLLGLRIHHTSNATAAQLNTVSMLSSVMDTIASENEITAPTSNSFDPTANQSWEVKAETSTTIVYDDSTDTISLNGTPFISNVNSSNANLADNGLLTIYIETENKYTFSIYCRKGVGTSE